MSEYQYYEFQAIDRPLEPKEQAALRACSSRARITATSFVNDYAFGSFKGNAGQWMERYFDAFIYLTGWGDFALHLRLPARVLPAKLVRPYCAGAALSIREKGESVILTLGSAPESGSREWVHGEGRLASLLPLRAELAQGDLRALYLAWLVAVRIRAVPEDAREPAVPAGLGELTAAQRALTELLQLDESLLDAAAAGSAPLAERAAKPREVRAWLSGLREAEKDRLLGRLVLSQEAPGIATELRRRFDRARGTKRAARGRSPSRTAGELVGTALGLQALRRDVAEDRRRAEVERAARKAAADRKVHLEALAGQERRLWREVEALVATRLPKSYAAAVPLLVDLRDLATRTDVGAAGAFGGRLQALQEKHSQRPAFLRRLRAAGL